MGDTLQTYIRTCPQSGSVLTSFPSKIAIAAYSSTKNLSNMLHFARVNT